MSDSPSSRNTWRIFFSAWVLEKLQTASTRQGRRGPSTTRLRGCAMRQMREALRSRMTVLLRLKNHAGCTGIFAIEFGRCAKTRKPKKLTAFVKFPSHQPARPAPVVKPKRAGLCEASASCKAMMCASSPAARQHHDGRPQSNCSLPEPGRYGLVPLPQGH
jgi:hypothetical protein